MRWRDKQQSLLDTVVDWHPSKRGRFGQRDISYHRFVGWYTTAPHPCKRAHAHCADQGQIGWRLHLVIGDSKRLGDKHRSAPPALCGLRPAHGWAMDLFIDAPCNRCLKLAVKRRLTLPELPT